MGIITHVAVSEKAGIAEIDPPINAGFARGGTHDIGDCVYSFELLEGRHDVPHVRDDNRRSLTQTARIDAIICNEDGGIDVTGARLVAEVVFKRYGRTLKWDN